MNAPEADISELALMEAGLAFRTVPVAEWQLLRCLDPALHQALVQLFHHSLSSRGFKKMEGFQIAGLMFFAASKADKLRSYLSKPAGAFQKDSVFFVEEHIRPWFLPHLDSILGRVFRLYYLEGFYQANAKDLVRHPKLLFYWSKRRLGK